MTAKKMRALRVGDVWDESLTLAAQCGETLTSAVERLLSEVYLPSEGKFGNFASLMRAVYAYRWERLATDLVIFHLKADRQDHTSAIRRTVIHDRRCKYAPSDHDGTGGRADGTYWQRHAAEGLSLRWVVERGADVCGRCKPNVDPHTVKDPS